ncbi:PQQ-binding-like beta-propeller repeat protein [Streptomyces sp. NPDC006512]|uniref:outer membrane protein assembly factor BamB family protein n=1 Tax=Streptomyces sp. NPDC006512 TaxID=3154307 RepID=UPI00339F23E5
MEGGRLGEGLLPGDPRSAGPYRLLARWPGPRAVPPLNGMYAGRDRDHGHAVVCLLPPAAYAAAQALHREPAPGVPAVLGLRTGAGPSWAALAYTPAVSLSDVAGRRPGAESGALSAEQSLRLAGTVADTLAALHARGIGYGAVAPDGVWLTTGRPLLMALHACRTLPGSEPEPGPAQAPEPARDGRPPRLGADPGPQPQSRVATVPAAFMAPEVAAGRPLTAAADVYALAVLLIHTATGRLPFGDGPPPVLAYRAVHDRPELPTLPAGVGEAVAAALAPAPADRPTAAELRRTLARTGDDPDRPAAPLPGRIVAALAVRAQEMADLETDGAPETPSSAPAGGADRPDGDRAPEPRPATAQAPRRGPAPAPAAPPAPPTRRRVLTGLLTGAAGAALGVSGTLAWSALARDPGRPAAPPAPGAGGGTSPRVPGTPPAALWRFDDNTARTQLLPVSGADRFLTVRGEMLYGHDLRTGKEVWQLPGTSIGSPPVQVPGDRFLLSTREGLSLCSLRDGRTQWLQRYDDLSEVLAVEGTTAWLSVGDGTPTGGHLLAAFDLKERKERWRTPMPDGFDFSLSVAVGPEIVVVEVQVPQQRHRDVRAVRTLAIAGFDRNGGRMLWHRTYPDVHGGPSSAVDPAGGGRLFLLSAGRAHAYELAGGTRLWESQAIVAGTNAPPLFTGGTLYLVDDGTGPIVAVAPDTGRTLWDQTLDENLEWFMLGRMAAGASGRSLYLATLNRVTATDLPSGKRLWQTGLAGVEAREPFQLATAPGVLLMARPSAVVALPAD